MNDKAAIEQVEIGNEVYYKISNSDSLRPFFMSIVSDSNHWMFIGSNGGLTAGRKNSDNALFPYYTDDKIIAGASHTGSKTVLLCHEEKGSSLWLPFSNEYSGCYRIQRNLYKNMNIIPDSIETISNKQNNIKSFIALSIFFITLFSFTKNIDLGFLWFLFL